MSDVITIDTGVGVSSQLRVEALPLYTDNYRMLSEVMPDYDVTKLPNNDISLLVARLKFTMKKFAGVGLSANQCGIKRRVFVVGYEDFQLTCINPKIVKTYGEMEKAREGCLSSPALTLNIPRHKKIDVEFYDENGNLHQLTMDGLTAICFQHELDHMNGIYFTDHVGEVSLLLARQKQTKIIKKYKRIK
jgi:peptide deformylase